MSQPIPAPNSALVHIALLVAQGAPPPAGIYFWTTSDSKPALSLDVDTPADLRAWLTLMGQPDATVVEDVSRDGTKLSFNAYPTWSGWQVYLHTSQPMPVDDTATVDEVGGYAVSGRRSKAAA